MGKKQKQNTDGGQSIGQNVFGGFGNRAAMDNLSPQIQEPVRSTVGIRREKQGRAGKWVTAVHGIERPLPRTEAARYLNGLKKQLGTGGKLTPEGFELQGDCVEAITKSLKEDGYRTKRTGA